MKGSLTKYKQRNGRVSWGYHFRPGRGPDGKWLRVTRQGFATKREADEALGSALRDCEKRAKLPPVLQASETFASFFALWLREHARRHCSPKTAERYEELGQYAVRYFGQVSLCDLRPVILELAFNELLDHGGRKSARHPEGRPLSPKTVREVAFLVFGVLKKAKAWDKIDQNPADFDKITLPRAQKSEAAILEKEVFAAFLKASRGTRLYPLILLAAATGARRGEFACCWPQ